jgi:hypothetical protein
MTPWSTWEDYLAGMWRPDMAPDRQEAAAHLLKDVDEFGEAAAEMLREWPNAAVQNLVHMWSGRNAWLGQATCCYSVAATSSDTRAAWGTLTNGEQRRANEVARAVRTTWERSRQNAQETLAL